MLGTSTMPAGLAHGGADWRAELKFDGWRATVTLDDRGLRVRSRTGRDLTDAVAELALPPAGLQGRHVVLDGELVTGAGTSEDFYDLGPRMARRSGAARGFPVTFVAFDVLWLDGVDLCARSYLERRLVLEELDVVGDRWQTSVVFDCGPAELLALCTERGLEGVVAKRAASRYQPGRRTSDWVKLKTPQWLSAHAPRRRPDPGRQSGGDQ